MALSRDQSLQLYGTERYTGWGEAEAAADARAQGVGSGQSGAYPNSLLSQMGGSVDKYVQDLLDFAKDDYDFAAKWIEQQFTDVMGTDDTARKEFLKQVANELENKIGTIAFDEQTNKYRLNEDTSKALTRLNEDERVARDELTTSANQEVAQQNSNLNQRGIIQGTRENATGLATRDIGLLNSDIQKRFESLDRIMGRKEEDIKLASNRGLEDLTTTARRAAEGSITQRDYNLAQAERERKSRELAAEQTRKQQKDYLAALEGAIA